MHPPPTFSPNTHPSHPKLSSARTRTRTHERTHAHTHTHTHTHRIAHLRSRGEQASDILKKPRECARRGDGAAHLAVIHHHHPHRLLRRRLLEALGGRLPRLPCPPLPLVSTRSRRQGAAGEDAGRDGWSREGWAAAVLDDAVTRGGYRRPWSGWRGCACTKSSPTLTGARCACRCPPAAPAQLQVHGPLQLHVFVPRHPVPDVAHCQCARRTCNCNATAVTAATGCNDRGPPPSLVALRGESGKGTRQKAALVLVVCVGA